MKLSIFKIHDYRHNVMSVPMHKRRDCTTPNCWEVNLTGAIWSLRLFFARWPGLSLWKNQIQQLRVNYPAV